METRFCLLVGRDIHKPNYARVRLSVNYGQFSEVFVQGHQNASLHVRMLQDLFIARILCPGSSPDDVVALRFKL